MISRRWLVLSGVLAAELMDLLDATVLTVAGPDLARSLKADGIDLQWILGGYLLTLGAGLVLGGRLGDRYGARRVYLAGLIGFIGCSLACAAAPNILVLISLRLFQGAFGALILPQGFVLLRATFSSERLNDAMAIFGPVMGAGTIIGPLLGGGLVQLNIFELGWRSVFLINVPIGLFAILIARLVAPPQHPDASVRIDVAGATLLACAAAFTVIPLILGQAEGWPFWTWFCLGAGALGLVGFASQQQFASQRGRATLIAPSLLRSAPFTAGVAAMWFFFSGTVGFPVAVMLLLQDARHFSAGHASTIALAYAGGIFVGSALSGAILFERLGRTVLQIGAIIEIAGATAIALVLLKSNSTALLTPGLFIWGTGNGLVIAGLITSVITVAKPNEIGSAAGALAAAQALAAAAGVALLCGTYFAFAHPSQGLAAAAAANVGLLLAFLVLTPLLPTPNRALHAEGVTRPGFDGGAAYPGQFSGPTR